MKKNFILSLFALFLIGALPSCVEDNISSEIKDYSDEDYAILSSKLNLPSTTIDYTVSVPNFLGGNAFVTPVDNDKATLGRVLFYDKKLSHNDTKSCASCHEPEKAFADGKDLSEGFDGEFTDRNSLALGSVVNFQSSYGGGHSIRAGFFWDDRALTVEEQSLETIQNPIEMGMDIDALGDKLLQEDYYRVLFRKAFGEAHNVLPMKDQVLSAIAAFVNSIASFDSKFDQGLREQLTPNFAFSNFTAKENQGKTLFVQNCASCHGATVSVTTKAVANNGLDLNYTDNGVGLRTGRTWDNGKFKVPMLRNIALTEPYMHDGRFLTLEEVVDHYSEGIQAHENLDHQLKNTDGTPKNMNFTAEEKEALVAFLHTLTDVESMVKERFLDPFK